MRQVAPESFGPYSIHEVIGIGGMASVHRAEQVGANLPAIALKRMLPQFADNDEAVEAFVREARLARMMQHANIARTFDCGKVGDVYFIAMELIAGRSLGQVVQRASRGVPLPLGVTLNLAIQVADALAYAHTLTDASGQPLGIIHRDVSPSNVIITDAGVAKLIDFGVAKGAGAGMQTQGVTLKGKFGYMAPEYLLGRLDARADLFALGVIIHELLTNVPLFSVDDELETMTRLRELPIEPPSRMNALVPAEIDAVVMTALERDPDRRWQHAHALRDALAAAGRDLGVIATDLAVVAAVEDLFGEVLTLAPTTAPPVELLTLEPSPLVVKLVAPKLEADDWTRDTNIRALIGTPTDGSKPLSLDDEKRALARPSEPERPARASLPPPPVVVLAPRRRRAIALAIALVIVAIAAVMFWWHR